MASNQFNIDLQFKGGDKLGSMITSLKEIERLSKLIGVSSAQGGNINKLIQEKKALFRAQQKLDNQTVVGAKAIAEKTKKQKLLATRSKELTKDIDNLTKVYQTEAKALNSVSRSTSKATGLLGKLKQEVTSLNKQRLMAKTPSDIEAINIKLQKAKQRIRELQTQGVKSSNTLSSAFASFGFKFNLLANVASRVGFMITNGITNAVIGTVKTFKDFEQANRNLASVLGERGTERDLGRLKEQAIELGTVTAKTSTEVVGLQTAFSRLGFSTKEILNLTSDTINGSIAMNSNLTETAEIVGAVVKSFDDLESTDAQKVIDQLVSSTQRSALSFNKLRTAIPIVGGAANAVGIPLNKMLALLGKLSDSGIDASMSATALRNIFINSAKQGLNYSEVLDKIVKNADKLTASTDEFGKRAAVSGAILAKNIRLTEDLALAIEEDMNVALEASSKQLDSLEGSLTLFQSAWQGMILSLEDGDGAFSGLIRNVVDFGTALLNSIAGVEKVADEMSEAEKKMADLVDTVIFFGKHLGILLISMKLLAPVVMRVGTAVIGLSRTMIMATTSARGFGLAMIKLGRALKKNLAGLILFAAFEIADHFDLFTSELDKLNDKIEAHTKLAVKSAEDKADSWQDNIAKTIKSLKEEARERKVAIKEELQDMNLTAERRKELEDELKGLSNQRLKDTKVVLEKEQDLITNQLQKVKAAKIAIEKDIADATKFNESRGGDELDLARLTFDVTKKKISLEEQFIALKELNIKLSGDLEAIEDRLANEVTETLTSQLDEKKAQLEMIKEEINLKTKLNNTEKEKIALELLKKRGRVLLEEIETLKKLQALEEDDSKMTALEKEEKKLADNLKLRQELVNLDTKEDNTLLVALKLEAEGYQINIDKMKELIALKKEDSKTDSEKFKITQLQADIDTIESKRKVDAYEHQIKNNKLEFDDNVDRVKFITKEQLKQEDIKADAAIKSAEIRLGGKRNEAELEKTIEKIEDTRDRNRINITKKGADRVKKTEEDKTDFVKNEIKKIEDAEVKKWNRNVEKVNELSKITLDAFKERKEAQIENLNDEITNNKDSIDRQAELADKGLKNSLAFEEEQGDALQAKKIEKQQQLEKLQLGEAFLALVTEFAKANPDTAFAKALGKIALVKAHNSKNKASKKKFGGIMGNEANEREGINGGMNRGVFYGDSHDSASGGVLIQAERGEGMFSRKEMANLGVDNFYKMKEQLRIRPAEDIFNQQNLSVLEVRKTDNQIGYNFGRLESKLSGIEHAIKSKPVSSTSFDKFGNAVETTLKDGMRKITKRRLRSF